MGSSLRGLMRSSVGGPSPLRKRRQRAIDDPRPSPCRHRGNRQVVMLLPSPFTTRSSVMSQASEDRASERKRREAPLATPTDLDASAARDIAGAMNGILADVFALYLKTKNFHWHMSGPHFRDYHVMLDEQADQLYAMTDPIAERIRKLGATTLRSIGHIARLQRLADNDA